MLLLTFHDFNRPELTILVGRLHTLTDMSNSYTSNRSVRPPITYKVATFTLARAVNDEGPAHHALGTFLRMASPILIWNLRQTNLFVALSRSNDSIVESATSRAVKHFYRKKSRLLARYV
jgi:hypothetical protein